MTISEIKEILKSGNLKAFKIALEQFDINEEDNYGNLLHYYISDAHLNEYLKDNYKEIIDLLLKKGIDIEAKTLGIKNKISPLHIAVQSHLKDKTNYLIELGADVNSIDGYGNTILITAVNEWQSINDDYFIKKLLDNGADVLQENNYGINAKTMILRYKENEGVRAFVPVSLLK